MEAASVKRQQSRVAKQGQGLSPGVGVSGIGLVLRNEGCAGWGGSDKVSPRRRLHTDDPLAFCSHVPQSGGGWVERS